MLLVVGGKVLGLGELEVGHHIVGVVVDLLGTGDGESTLGVVSRTASLGNRLVVLFLVALVDVSTCPHAADVTAGVLQLVVDAAVSTLGGGVNKAKDTGVEVEVEGLGFCDQSGSESGFEHSSGSHTSEWGENTGVDPKMWSFASSFIVLFWVLPKIAFATVFGATQRTEAPEAPWRHRDSDLRHRVVVQRPPEYEGGLGSLAVKMSRTRREPARHAAAPCTKDAGGANNAGS